MASSVSSKLEPVIWSRDTGHIGIHGLVDVRSYGRTVTKTKLSDGLPYFLVRDFCFATCSNYSGYFIEITLKVVFCCEFSRLFEDRLPSFHDLVHFKCSCELDCFVCRVVKMVCHFDSCYLVHIFTVFQAAATNLFLNSRVFLSRNYRLIVASRKFDVLKTNICPRSEASRANMLVLRISNFQGATIKPIVPRHKHSIVFIVHH